MGNDCSSTQADLMGRRVGPTDGLLITTRKSHTVFRLVPTSVTLNDLNGVTAVILFYFTKFDSFAGLLRHSG